MLTNPIRLTDLLETANKSAIARKLGVDSTTVARWARGETQPPANKLLELSKLLHVSADLIVLHDATK